MPLSSPTCYLSAFVTDADWEGDRGGPQWVIRERWTLEVEPRNPLGWAWRLIEEPGGGAAPAVVAQGLASSEDGTDAETAAKRHAVDALTQARDGHGK